MAWIKVDQSLVNHGKILDLSDQLNIEPASAIGYMVAFWCWAIDVTDENGDISKRTAKHVERAAYWTGDAGALFNAMIDVGFIDVVGDRKYIHDWAEYGGKLIADRNKESERKRKERAKKRLSDGLSDGTSDGTSDGLSDGTSDGLSDGTFDGCPPYKSRVEKSREENNKTLCVSDLSENASPALVKEKKHKYGLYKNVLLTDEDLSKLQSEFPQDWSKRIERLSEYMASKGKSYKNHLATIRAWSRSEAPYSSEKCDKPRSDEEMEILNMLPS